LSERDLDCLQTDRIWIFRAGPGADLVQIPGLNDGIDPNACDGASGAAKKHRAATQASQEAYDGIRYLAVALCALLHRCRVGSRILRAARWQSSPRRTPRTTEPHGGDAGRSDDEAAETIFEARGVEVHQQTDTEISHTEVSEKLRIMSGDQGGDGFDFQDYRICNDDVGAKAQWNRHIFVNKGNIDLSFKAHTGVARFKGHTRGIHRFQQAWTNGAMDLNGESDDFFREGSLFEHEELRDPLWSSVFSVVKISER
jgi:hypothetical protein